MDKIINLSQLAGLSQFSSEFSSLADDYVFSHFTSPAKKPPFKSAPIKLEGACWLLCFAGHINLNVNLENITIKPNMLLHTHPDSIIEIKEIDNEQTDYYVLFLSRDFMRDLNFDINILSSIPRSNSFNRSLCYEISTPDATLLRHYFELLHHNTTINNDDMIVRSIARCIIAALCYQLIGMARQNHPGLNLETDSEGPAKHRRSSYVEDFFSLVHHHHRSQRSVSFYASKLFISPKYLSLVIKKATGKSAAELIDEFVILEAKNLLRFSGKNIQQIAYELNFPNQSSFGKYFKHLTGMSPSHYQRT